MLQADLFDACKHLQPYLMFISNAEMEHLQCNFKPVECPSRGAISDMREPKLFWAEFSTLS